VVQRTILPSLLSAPFDRLGDAIRPLEQMGCRLIHYDVMDGHFVPNLTFGPLVISSLAPHCSSDFDVHLMVTNPETVYPWFVLDRVRTITVHGEATPNLHALLMRIRDAGKLAGVSLNPATPVDGLAYVLPYVDLVQVLTVNPGFGGQGILLETVPKICALRALRDEHGAEFLIQVDGGINAMTLDTVLEAGAEELVIGHAIFDAADPAAAYCDLDRRVKQFG
jgi:ribulose-phosphate 3-epimerase